MIRWKLAVRGGFGARSLELGVRRRVLPNLPALPYGYYLSTSPDGLNAGMFSLGVGGMDVMGCVTHWRSHWLAGFSQVVCWVQRLLGVRLPSCWPFNDSPPRPPTWGYGHSGTELQDPISELRRSKKLRDAGQPAAPAMSCYTHTDTL